MKYISKVLLLGVSLLVSGVVMPSCERKKEFDLEAYVAEPLQISSFSMSTSQEGVDLSGYFFAIAHYDDGGVITNSRPLPYNLDLTQVSLTIQASSALTKLYVALGDGEYQAYKSGETKLDIPHTVDKLRVKVELPSGSTTTDTSLASYIYTVQLTRYQYDPRTISWESATSPSGAMLPGSGTSGVVAYGDGHLFYDATTGQCYQVSYSEVGVPSITALSLGGIPTGEHITTLAEGDGVIYALTDQGDLYKLSANTWQALGLGREVESLLAVVPTGRTGVEPVLSLLLAGDTPTFASYVGGELTTYQEAVPEHFPRKGDYCRAFVSTKSYVGSSATMLATSYSNGKLYRTTWYFTAKSKGWMPVASQEVESAELSGTAFLVSEGIYYRLEATPTGLVVLASEDAKTWTDGEEQSLGDLDLTTLAGRNILAWSTSANTIALLSGVGNTGATSVALWLGTPLRNVTQ